MIERRHGRCRVLILVLTVVLVQTAVIPEAVAQEPAPAYYGTADTNFHYISAEEFQSRNTGPYVYTDDGFWKNGDSSVVQAMAPLRLPSGALVDGFVVIYDDSDLAWPIELALHRYWVGALGATGKQQFGPSFMSSGDPGVRSTWVDLDPDITISYYISAALTTQSYAFTVYLPPTSADVSFRGIIVHWKRQISAAPGSPTFPDVAPGFWAFQEIEALAASGITTGFPDGTFRPTDPVTRAQMATFLARALGLHWAP
jgi:hypothetical protein